MLKELDGFRALAVTLVVLFHAGFYTKAIPGFNEVIGTGYLGVQIFFILSSLLLSRQNLLYYPQTVNKKQYTLTFFKKRLLRIVPLYLISSIVLAAFSYKSIDFSFWKIIQYVLFIKDDLHVNVVIWSLFVEVRFYILLPVLMGVLFSLQKHKVTIFLVPVLVILYSYWYRYTQLSLPYNKEISERLYSSLSANVDCLGWGMIIAILYERYKALLFKPATITAIATLLLVLIFGLMYVQYHKVYPPLVRIVTPLNNICWSALILMVMLGKTTIFNKILSAKAAVYVSMLSYSIYLWHLPIRTYIVEVLQQLLTGNSAKYIVVLQLILTLGLSLLVSALSYRFIEKPFLNKKSA
ncbi:acyltransferase family protein [Mucilaginibacter terrae]|uniref:Peptidoglycan/LPS O-acetylase OafA/YrhL n=1 Tax=Mucilaginibacter terrae TaxID=1955052 RepID=A0ABU3H0L0_9SPHI|nr:acyltransferase [Mucilaginibacter terrae]MDT3404782.1 peptidoglycan/LPS O-acetylase OafA/YrhL [Mucilaginibacter terrae]